MFDDEANAAIARAWIERNEAVDIAKALQARLTAVRHNLEQDGEWQRLRAMEKRGKQVHWKLRTVMVRELPDGQGCCGLCAKKWSGEKEEHGPGCLADPDHLGKAND